ncbi:MAG: MOP flippase family protein [Leptolyngbyaceae cyanobacterium SM1_4_3]|nr:MOP flippase family protein [Leptolyngbyaceae cyanobacterium SM1_4_3]NJN89268.1 MOP flippase family protein [Leptolyngbyaceae cyanobacterium SL_5_14]
MSLRQKAVKGVVWTAIGNWGSQLISFAVFFLLARLLGPEAFGLVALASVFFAFMQVFLDQGFGQALVQRQNLEPEHLDTAFWTNLGIGILLSLVTIVAADQIAEIFKEPRLVAIVRLMSLNFIFGGLNSVQDAILSRELNFKKLAIRSLISIATGGIVGVTMALQGYGVWSLVGQSLSNGLASVITLWTATNWHPKFKFSTKHFKELFIYGINVVGINLLNFVNRRSDDFLIGYFLGSVALGYYSVAYRILMITSQLMIGTIQKIAMPVFSRLQHDPDKLRQALYQAIQITSLFAFPVFIGLSILSPELIPIIFGEQWKPSIPVMQILNLVGILYAGFYYNGPMIMALGKPSWNLWLNCLQAVGNVIFFLIAVRWGIVAVAASYVIRGYLMAPITVWVVSRVLPLKLFEYLRQYAAPFAATGVMVAIIFGTKSLLGEVVNTTVLLVLCIAVGAIAYSVTILLIAPQLLQRAIALFRSALPQSKLKKT